MRRAHAGPALAVLILATLAGCSDAPKTSDKSLAPIQYDELLNIMANPGRPRNKNVFSVFKKQSEGKTILVDVRSKAKYDAGHIPGAVNIALPDLEASSSSLAEATAIVVYASGWTDYLSPAGAKKLLALGYQNVYEFRGGLELWQAEGGRIEVSQEN